MEKVKTLIQYKTKVQAITVSENHQIITKLAFMPKKELSKHDCNLKPHNHWAYNSDLFSGILNGAHNAITKGNWIYLDKLPEGVAVNTDYFLAKVTIEVLI